MFDAKHFSSLQAGHQFRRALSIRHDPRPAEKQKKNMLMKDELMKNERLKNKQVEREKKTTKRRKRNSNENE